MRRIVNRQVDIVVARYPAGDDRLTVPAATAGHVGGHHRGEGVDHLVAMIGEFVQAIDQQHRLLVGEGALEHPVQHPGRISDRFMHRGRQEAADAARSLSPGEFALVKLRVVRSAEQHRNPDPTGPAIGQRLTRLAGDLKAKPEAQHRLAATGHAEHDQDRMPRERILQRDPGFLRGRPAGPAHALSRRCPSAAGRMASRFSCRDILRATSMSSSSWSIRRRLSWRRRSATERGSAWSEMYIFRSDSVRTRSESGASGSAPRSPRSM